jgi:hypothetical protein
VKDSLQTSYGLLDIEPPVVPVDTGLATQLTGIALIILLIILAMLTIRHFTSSRSKARRHLRQLQRSVKNEHDMNDSNDIDAFGGREVAYKLARLLAVGIDINGVISSTALPVELNHQKHRWQLFTSKLSAARYEKQDSHPSSLDGLFKETLFWLKNWP